MLSTRETMLFDEIFQLMASKYPEMLDKFGIWRAHEHFSLNEDEVFHETSNNQTRESTLKIINKKDLPKSSIATTWKLTEHGSKAATWCCEDQKIV